MEFKVHVERRAGLMYAQSVFAFYKSLGELFCACLHMCCMSVPYHMKACLNYDITCQRYVNCLQKKTVCISCFASLRF